MATPCFPRSWSPELPGHSRGSDALSMRATQGFSCVSTRPMCSISHLSMNSTSRHASGSENPVVVVPPPERVELTHEAAVSLGVRLGRRTGVAVHAPLLVCEMRSRVPVQRVQEQTVDAVAAVLDERLSIVLRHLEEHLVLLVEGRHAGREPLGPLHDEHSCRRGTRPRAVRRRRPLRPWQVETHDKVCGIGRHRSTFRRAALVGSEPRRGTFTRPCIDHHVARRHEPDIRSTTRSNPSTDARMTSDSEV
jgi:hypothetical protein